MFSRPFPLAALTATTMFVGSTAGGVQIAATNLTRAELRIQPLTDGLRVSPIGSLTGSSMLVASQGFFIAPAGLTGPLFASPNGAATAPVAIWESSG